MEFTGFTKLLFFFVIGMLGIKDTKKFGGLALSIGIGYWIFVFYQNETVKLGNQLVSLNSIMYNVILAILGIIGVVVVFGILLYIALMPMDNED